MTNEIFEKLFSVLLDISNNLESIPFWKDYTFWISLLNVIVLGATLYFLIRYTNATKKMAENQLTPMVDVNMIYDKSIGKTYFWFLNASSMPALVLIKYNINKGEKDGKIGPLRISPYHPHYPQFKRTAIAFLDFFKNGPSDKTEIILNITVTPAFENNHIKFNFIKSYRFKKSESRWDETSWGYPDPSFPSFINSKNKKQQANKKLGQTKSRRIN